ncbi:alpha/beta-hydrolase [Gloeophyllum trabeum ATCC 11539]|uniref:Alpha/beta-hydrolase n=1 Tax=Gloeophyllum trabeum (strain ATCC 11539 / FP-39264 / Madison 617) TaxID=670483 RepID=S7RG56_GLOTA|nr:alpha/beta-hydrolase [Gloeophyllum trabeum ATCC 11539]EPQ53215.1 alpha/beta-hydrolase [Gloeophyllum trabeum ATCC 11539]
MPVTPELLKPLVSSTFILDHRLSGSSLQVVAKRYLDPANPIPPSDNSAVTLLFAHGIGLTTELWLPIIKTIYKDSVNAGHKIRSIWAVDCPNHGDAHILNEEVLKDQYPSQFSLREYGAAISTFLSSGLLSSAEVSNLVGVGHSGGGGALAVAAAIACICGGVQPLFKGLICVDSPWMQDRSAKPAFEELVQVLVSMELSKPREWPDKKAAVEYLSARPPYSNFHPDVMHVLEETHFRAVSSSPDDPRVALKTSNEQEAATWNSTDDAFAAAELLEPTLKATPTHLILATRTDIWPPQVLEMLKRTVESHREQLASVAYIDASHYIPQERPYELAEAILAILNAAPGRISDDHEDSV